MRPRGAGRAMAALAATILAMVPLAAAHADAAAAEAAIRQRLVAWRDAFNAGDAAAACDLFAPDLVYALPDVPDGTQASMCRNLKRVLARSDIRFRYSGPQIHEIIVSGDLAVVRLAWPLEVETKATIETTIEEGMDIFRLQAARRWSLPPFIAFTPQAPGR